MKPNLDRAWFPGLVLAGALVFPVPHQAVDNASEIRIAAAISSDQLELTWSPGLVGQSYTVQFRDSLSAGAWRDAAGAWPISATHWIDPIAGTQLVRFYRVMAQAPEIHPPPLSLSQLSDLDEDGLSTYAEGNLGTDPALADTDHDGLVDGYEVFLRDDPHHASLSTDPRKTDSNGDFIDDFLEVYARVNALPLPATGITDTDGDGLTDRQEFFLRTKATATDSDGDGVADRAELMRGGNPANAADGGDGRFYIQFGAREEMHYLFDPSVMGIGIDTLKLTIGYVQPPPTGSPGMLPSAARMLADSPGNPPIGTGDGGRDIYMVYVVTLRNGDKAAVVPKNVCPTGLVRLCPQLLRQEKVTLHDGRVVTMTTIVPFSEIPLPVLQQCCVNDAGAVDPDSLLGKLAELFGNDIEVLRTVANFVLKHGLVVLDEKDRDRMFATRLKFIRCCNMDVVSATAAAMAIMVAVNTDNLAVEFVLQLLPAHLGDVISLADRALLAGMLQDFGDGLIPDDAVTQFLCDLVVKYLCPNAPTPTPPGCSGNDSPLPGAQTPQRPPHTGESDPDQPGDGNGRDEPVGHSVPPPYDRDDPPPENPKGNKAPPGGAEDREAGQEDKRGIAGPKGGPGDPKPGPPPGGTPGGGPFPIPYLLDDPPPTNFPTGWRFEFGDAPDAGLLAGYPVPNDAVVGRFATVYRTSNSRYSQPGAHIVYPGYFWLGVRYSREADALSGDEDPEPNLDPSAKLSNRDFYDDGLLLPISVNPCGFTGLHITVNSWANTPASSPYVNVLIDFNRDGEWSGAVEGAAEWAVQNLRFDLKPGEEQVVPLPPVQTPCTPFPAWMRILVSDLPVPLVELGSKGGWDGSGRFNFGEVEDYYVEQKLGAGPQ